MTPNDPFSTKDSGAKPRIRFGVTEWVVGVGLLFGSLPGPWLTIAFPAGIAFALRDRRRRARWIGGGVAAVVAVLTLGSAAGAVLLGAAVLAIAGTAVATRRRGLGLDAVALPALGLSGAGLAIGAAITPGAIARWEEALRSAVDEGTAMAIESYRAFGVDDSTLETVRAAAETSARWAVELWPALVVTALWLGAWLGWRFLGRWGKVDEPLAERLADRGFTAFRLDDVWLWLLIAGLGALWLPGGRRIGANVALVVAGLHALQGLAVLDYGLERRGWGRLARALVPGAAIALVPPIGLGGALAIGLADHWVTFREGADRASREDS